MTGILDTHAFVWFDSQPSKLSAAAIAFLEHPENQLLVSVASIWEIVIKAQLGKFALRAPLNSILDEQQDNGIQQLPIELEHVLNLQQLPMVHRDPFDRIIVAQAIHLGAVIISADVQLSHYPVTVIW